MARQTKQPELLRELWAALGNDPFVIAECLARPALANRLTKSWYGTDRRPRGERKSYTEPVATVERSKEPFDTWGGRVRRQMSGQVAAPGYAYRLTQITSGSGLCTDDTWALLLAPPSARDRFTAVWTGSEMIVWGGFPGLNTGGRYDPATDIWTPTSTTNTPSARYRHTAVWTGREMIVWGGLGGIRVYLNTGGRYDPDTDTWAATSLVDAPSTRELHTAVWADTEMIVWGGYAFPTFFNTGGRYDLAMDRWTPTNTISAPEARSGHTAVWTGTEMIVWGGGGPIGTGGRYCASASREGPPRQ